MFETIKHVFLCIAVILLNSNTCTKPTIQPTLVMYSPGDPEYREILVRREGDNLTLICVVLGDSIPRSYQWNYINDDGIDMPVDTSRSFVVEPVKGFFPSSKLKRKALKISDTGHYMCSMPPYSVTKYVLVQPPGPTKCVQGTFSCGERCVLAEYLCDGWQDCLHGEDEATALCGVNPCAREDKLNCTTGRCISLAVCCDSGTSLRRRYPCCDELICSSSFHEGVAVDYTTQFGELRAPDGFYLNMTYIFNACVLIVVMSAVVLMFYRLHRKRLALISANECRICAKTPV